jgi:hypothetical protein
MTVLTKKSPAAITAPGETGRKTVGIFRRRECAEPEPPSSRPIPPQAFVRSWLLLRPSFTLLDLTTAAMGYLEMSHADATRYARAAVLRLLNSGQIEIASPGQRGSRSGNKLYIVPENLSLRP